MRKTLIIGALVAAASFIIAPASAMALAPASSSPPAAADAAADIVLTAGGGVSGSAKRRYYKQKSYDHDYHGDHYYGERNKLQKQTTGRNVYKGFGPKQGDYRFSYTGRVGGIAPRSGSSRTPVTRHTRPRIIQLH